MKIKAKIVLTLLYIALLLSTTYIKAQDIVKLSFIGDIMQHKGQLKNALMYNHDTLLSSSYDYSSYFKYTKKYISKSDISIANMEFCCNTIPYTGYPNFSAPKALAEEAYNSGIDVFLCANNHICDKNKTGLYNTIKTYKDLGVLYTGISNKKNEKKYLIIEKKGIKFGLLNFTYGLNGHIPPKNYYINMIDNIFLKNTINKIKEEGVDYIICLPHWGNEYKIHKSIAQEQLKDSLYKWGADIIIGNHPHVIQEEEIERDSIGFPIKICKYSLGNYISNMSAKNTELGIIYHISFYKDRISEKTHIIKTENIPIWTARAYKLDKSFTVIPIKEYLNNDTLFLNKNNYHKMEKTYKRLKNIIDNK